MTQRSAITVKLEPDELERLNRPVVGEGGFQRLLRRLQQGIDGDTLTVTAADLERIAPYREAGNGGGFQDRLKIRALSRLTLSRREA